MIFANDLVQFNTEDVKTYQRLNKGKLVTVNQYKRKAEPSNPQTDKSLINSIQTGAMVTGGVALAGLSLVGIGAATRAYIVSAHSKSVANAVSRIKTSPEIPNLQFLSKSNPKNLPTDFSQYEGVLITTGGYAGTKGQHTLQLHSFLEKEFPNHLVLSVENLYNDLGWEKDTVKRYSKLPSLLWNNATKGDKTAEELGKLANLVRTKTDKPITFATASGGGMAVKEAQEITDGLGLKDIQGFGLGSPTWNLSQPKSKYISIMDKNDAGTGWLPKTSKRDLVPVDRGSDPVTWDINSGQGEVAWSKQHEYGTYLTHPKPRSIVDQMVYRNRKDLSVFKPENYTVLKKGNSIQLNAAQTEYGKLERLAWVNFDVIFPSTVNFAQGEQNVKVKSYVREGKLVRQYTAKRDKALEDQSIIDKLRANVSETVEQKTGDANLARTVGTVAVVGAVGTAGVVGGKILLGSTELAVISSATKAWDRAYPKRVQMIDAFADDLVSGKRLFRGQRLQDIIGDADTVITVKGGINMDSKGGTLIKNKYLQGMATPKDKWAILDLDNLELDSNGLKDGKLNVGQTVKDWWQNFATGIFTKGYNKDSIEIAGYMKAVEKLKPDASKVMIGYSAGAVATNAAAAELSKMQSVSKLKSINFGLPYTGIVKIQNGNRVVDNVAFINKDDILANTGLSRGSKADINAIMQDRPNKTNKDGLLAGHAPESYFGSEDQRKRIYKAITQGSAGGLL